MERRLTFLYYATAPKLESFVALLRPDFVFLIGSMLSLEFGLDVPLGNHTAGCHLTVIVSP
ncbi:hypothetical protein HanIR_Chr12g0570181 [Helianthus annuus]|nr:hypothetical protein HanIR_Chr12g0570181 [Helianthus annuus]